MTNLMTLFISVLMSGWISTASTNGNQAPVGFGAEENNSLAQAENEEKLLMIILEMDDLLCFLCTESLLNFCRLLPEHIQRERTWMVVVGNVEKPTEYKKKIISKKIEGFLKGNGLCIPVCIDFSRLFGLMRPGYSFILLLNEKNRTFDRYDFPLDSEITSKVLEEILR